MPQNLRTHADVTLAAAAPAVELLAANPNRITVIIYNAGSSLARVGDAATAAAQGVPLAANSGITIETTAAVYGFSTAGTTLAVTETFRP